MHLATQLRGNAQTRLTAHKSTVLPGRATGAPKTLQSQRLLQKLLKEE
jgi:hypothetical protein